MKDVAKVLIRDVEIVLNSIPLPQLIANLRFGITVKSVHRLKDLERLKDLDTIKMYCDVWNIGEDTKSLLFRRIGEADGYDDDTRPDWSKKCTNCEQTPIVPMTGLCGPCTFGEAATMGGNW